MRAIVLALAVVLLAASGGSGATRGNARPDPDYRGVRDSTPPPPDAGVAFTGTRPMSCPATFPAAGGACDPKVANQQCAYAEGSCYCGVTYPCSGVAHSPEEIASWPTSWQCTVTPPLVRPDGCPGSMPNGDAACSPDGKVCSWGDCCFHQMTCTAGKWQMTGGGCPP